MHLYNMAKLLENFLKLSKIGLLCCYFIKHICDRADDVMNTVF